MNILFIILVLIFAFVIFKLYLYPSLREKFKISYVQTVKIDGACKRPNAESPGEIIMFRRQKWLLHDLSNNNVKMGPFNMSQHEWFKDLPEPFSEGIDCIVQRPTDNRELIIFKDSKWLIWNFSTDSMGNIGGDIGPYTINQHPWFLNLPEAFNYQIDAVCLDPSRPNTHLIFFKNSQWLIWDFKNDVKEEGPYSITELFNKDQDFPQEFEEGIDCAFNDPLYTGDIILTKNDKFIKLHYYNTDTKQFPKNIKLGGPIDILSDASPYKEAVIPFIEDGDSLELKEYVTLDKSGKGHHSTLYNIESVGTLPNSNDKFDIDSYGLYKKGKALRFNGKNSFMKMPSINELYKKGFTFALFFRQSDFISYPRKPRTLVKSDHDINWLLEINKDGYLEFKTKLSKSLIWKSIKSKMKIDSNWHHVTITQDSQTVNMYLDDKHISKMLKTQSFPKNPVEIIVGTKGNFPNFYDYFEGLIGDFRVYNSAHNQDKICTYNPFCFVPEEENVIVQDIIDKCVYTPKGLSEIDCFKECN